MRFSVIALATALAAPLVLAERPHNAPAGGWNVEAPAGNPNGPLVEAPAAPTPASSPAANSPLANSPVAQTPAAHSHHGKKPAKSTAAQSPAAQSPAAQNPAAQSPAAQSPADQSPAAQTAQPKNQQHKGHKSSSDDGAPAPTTAPTSGGGSGSSGSSGAPGQGGAGAMTWNIVNKVGTPVSLVYGQNGGVPSPVGSPSDGMLASSIQIVFPSGWAGRVIVGPNGNTAGSKIEGSVDPNFNVDISYVDGYTYPITCTDKKAGTVFIGCNIDLFKQGSKCADQAAGPICLNTETADNAPNGPPPAFFAPCAGAAYTFPNDNGADRVSTGAEIDCCVGAACPASVLQSGAKRSLNDVERRWGYPRHVFADAE